ncbi:hypothetical protein BJY01DRAFT_113485 [Aspergillus pseudoustus]|uniref:Uncharacterized protein n=1 Tax=Aspergillus pseudoustus TaxID=1810923 RepID=A0ABR4L0Q7_9EURO
MRAISHRDDVVSAMGTFAMNLECSEVISCCRSPQLEHSLLTTGVHVSDDKDKAPADTPTSNGSFDYTVYDPKSMKFSGPTWCVQATSAASGAILSYLKVSGSTRPGPFYTGQYLRNRSGRLCDLYHRPPFLSTRFIFLFPRILLLLSTSPRSSFKLGAGSIRRCGSGTT